MDEGAKRGKVCSPATCEVLFGARRRARARRREARQGSQPGDVRSSLWRASAGECAKREGVCSPATCGVVFGARRRAVGGSRGVPRRVSASAKARGLATLSTPGGLGHYWAAQCHLARAVGKRFRGCRAKRLYVHFATLPWIGFRRSQWSFAARWRMESAAHSLLATEWEVLWLSCRRSALRVSGSRCSSISRENPGALQ